MNPDSNSQNTLPPTDSTRDWFDQADVPTVPPPPKRSSKRVLVIFAVILSLVLIAGGILVILVRNQEQQAQTEVSTSCFSANNYQDLLTLIRTVNDDDIELSDVKPQELLYAHYVYFAQNTTTIDVDASPEGTKTFLTALGEYYRTKQSTGPIVIHLSATYTSLNNPATVNLQLNTVRNILVLAGVDSSHIVVDTPTLITLDSDTDFEDSDAVVVSLAPSVNCDTQGVQ